MFFHSSADQRKNLCEDKYQRSGPLLISHIFMSSGRHSHGIEPMRPPVHRNLSYHLVFVPYRKIDEVVLTILCPQSHGCDGIGEIHVIDIWSAVYVITLSHLPFIHSR